MAVRVLLEHDATLLRYGARAELLADYQEYAADLPPHIYPIYLADLLGLDLGGAPTSLVALVTGRIVGTARLYGAGSTGTARLPADPQFIALAYRIDLSDVELPGIDDTDIDDPDINNPAEVTR
ncbi:MAG: hypothetical protein ACRDTC_24940 [Pseudonocardiaceae bacterium]